MLEKRPQIEAALRCVRKGATLIVTKIDRLARSITKLITLAKQISGEGVALRILDPDINMNGPMDQLVLNYLAAWRNLSAPLCWNARRQSVYRILGEAGSR